MNNREFTRYMQSMEFHTDSTSTGWCSDEKGKVLEIDIVNSTHEWEGNVKTEFSDVQLDKIFSELYEEIVFHYNENTTYENINNWG